MIRGLENGRGMFGDVLRNIRSHFLPPPFLDSLLWGMGMSVESEHDSCETALSTVGSVNEIRIGSE